jgi:hypothetical protein
LQSKSIHAPIGANHEESQFTNAKRSIHYPPPLRERWVKKGKFFKYQEKTLAKNGKKGYHIINNKVSGNRKIKEKTKC